LLGDASNVLVGRSKGGSFTPLHSTPEFRDLVVAAGGLPPGSHRVPASSSVRGADSQSIDLGALPGPVAGGSRAGRAGAASGSSGRVAAPLSGRFVGPGSGRLTPDIGPRARTKT